MMRSKPLFKNKKYTLMKDFDVLAMHTQAQKQLYDQANFQKGLQMTAPMYVRNQEGQKFLLNVSIEQFHQFGPGIYLMFLFLKYATILFLFLSIFSFVNIGLLLEGGQLNTMENNFQISMAKSTLGNVQSNQLVVIIIFDYIITVVTLAAIIFWKQKQASYVVQCCKKIMLPSYQTVVLKQIPQLYTQFDMKVFFQERFGQVEDIYTVRNFNNDLYHYKGITKIANQFKEQRALVRIQPQRSSIKLAKLFFDYQNYYFKMQKQNRLAKYPKEFAYVTFKSVKSRQEILKFYQRTFPGLSEQKKQHYLYKTDVLKLKACLMEPNGIIWQNLNLPIKSKYMWILIQIFLLILVLLISIIVIFILYVSESGMSGTQYYGKSKQQIIALDNKDALQSYCLGLSIQSFHSDTDCTQFQAQYAKFTILFVALPLVISIFKFALTQIMKASVSLRRHPYQIAKIQSQIIIMFAFYFFATGILQYIVFLQISFQNGATFSFVDIMSPIQNALLGYLDIDTKKMSLATDFNRNWYTIASYKIILISLVSFNVSSFGKIAYSFLRKLACDFYARKQQLQCRMNYWLEGQTIQIQFVYAVATTIICFLLLFGASLPLIYPFTCVSLFILFWSTKFIFINYCAKPLLYSHSMNSLIVKILLMGVILHCIVAPLFFGARSIHSQRGIRNFLRIPYFGYYIVPIVISLAYVFYRQNIANFFQKIKNYYQYSDERGDDFVARRTKKMSLPSKLCLIQTLKDKNKNVMNYSMHQNPQYQCILKTLYTINKQERVRATCVLNKQLGNLLQKDDIFAETDENNFPPKLFSQLLKKTEQNFHKFQRRVGRQYSKSNNPYKYYLKELKQVERYSKISQIDPELYTQIQSQGFMSNSLKSMDLSHMKESLESNKNINWECLKKLQSLRRRYEPKPELKQIMQRSVQQSFSRRRKSVDEEQQEAPNSDVRLRSTLNIGLVSNLGMTSSIGRMKPSISNLGTVSRILRRKSSKQSQQNQQNLKETYFLQDQFDSIKQTKSILDQKVYSKRYAHEPPEKDTNQQYQINIHLQNKNQQPQATLSQYSQKMTARQQLIKPNRRNQMSVPKHKSKKQQIFQAYKRKKRPSQNVDRALEPSQTSHTSQSY